MAEAQKKVEEEVAKKVEEAAHIDDEKVEL
jgi:hypothetical protein